MVNKSLLIGVGILIAVGFGLMFMSNMTGNVITSSSVVEKIDIDEPFRISYFGADDEVPTDIEVKNGA